MAVPIITSYVELSSQCITVAKMAPPLQVWDDQIELGFLQDSKPAVRAMLGHHLFVFVHPTSTATAASGAS